MNVTRRTIVAGGLAGAAAACASGGAPLMRPQFSGPRPVIFHTDIGGDVDDTWALVQLMRTPELDVKLIALDNENTKYRARLTAKLLTALGRTDVPLALGTSPTDDPGRQSAWVGDYQLSSYPGPVLPSAIDAIIDTVTKSPEPVTIISVGPTQDLGRAVRKDPGFAQNAIFVGMHGSIRIGYDGTHAPTAEYNVKAAPDALRAVLAAKWRDALITPLDTCGLLKLTGERYQRVRASADPGARAIMENNIVWAPLAEWMKGYDPAVESSTLFDSAAVVLAYNERPFVMETLPILVTDEGMTVIDRERGSRVRCATAWLDKESVLDTIMRKSIGA